MFSIYFTKINKVMLNELIGPENSESSCLLVVFAYAVVFLQGVIRHRPLQSQQVNSFSEDLKMEHVYDYLFHFISSMSIKVPKLFTLLLFHVCMYIAVQDKESFFFIFK